jgi:repressor LexA
MINEGIMPGDLVILDKMIEPSNGDVVAAHIDGAWTLKYFRKDQQKVYLEAANPNYPIFHPKEQLEIGGVVVKVIREYH